MSKRLAILALAAAALVAPALAADLPTKAAPQQRAFFQPYNGSGFYFGLEVAGGAGSVNVSGIPGVNSASLTQTQGIAGGIFGYSSPLSGARYWFAEADVGFQNFNGNTQGFALGGPVSIQLLAGAGMPASEALAVLPTFGLTPPTLPLISGASASNPHIYLAAGVDISDISAAFALNKNTDWQFSPLVAIGLESSLSTGGVIGARTEYVIQTDSICVGGLCSKTGNVVREKIYWKF